MAGECSSRNRRAEHRARRRAMKNDWAASPTGHCRVLPTARRSPRFLRRGRREEWSCQNTSAHGSGECPAFRNRGLVTGARATHAGRRPLRNRRNWHRPARELSPHRPAMRTLRPIHSGQISTRPAGSYGIRTRTAAPWKKNCSSAENDNCHTTRGFPRLQDRNAKLRAMEQEKTAMPARGSPQRHSYSSPSEDQILVWTTVVQMTIIPA